MPTVQIEPFTKDIMPDITVKYLDEMERYAGPLEHGQQFFFAGKSLGVATKRKIVPGPEGMTLLMLSDRPDSKWPGRLKQALKPTHIYTIRPRKDHRGVDLISDVLPFGGLWYAEPNAIANAIGYAEHRSRSHRAVIRVYDKTGNVIEMRDACDRFHLNNPICQRHRQRHR
jgi:hypothetical protein